MGMSENRRNAPWWVRLALFGSRTRGAVMGYFWMCVLSIPVFVGLGLWLRSESPVFAIPAIMFFVGAAWGVVGAASYWGAARWADRNGGWETAPPHTRNQAFQAVQGYR
jgi:hypothetical protein